MHPYQPYPYRAARGKHVITSILTAAALFPMGAFAEVVSDSEPNDSLEFPQLVTITDLTADSEIGDETSNTSTLIPHVTIAGTGDGSFDHFSFVVNQGDRIILDIDHANFDSVIALYDPTGDPVVSNDDSDTSVGADGSTSEFDSYLEYIAEQAGTYIVRVSNFDFGPLTGDDSYRLQISVGEGAATGHSSVVLRGDEVYDTNATFTTFGSPIANEAGTVAFAGKVAGESVDISTDAGVFVKPLSGLSYIFAQEGGFAASDDSVFKIFKDPILCENGAVFFRATVAGPTVTLLNDTGIWGGYGYPYLIAREGSEANGTSGGVYQSFVSMAASGHSSFVYTAKLKVGVGSVTVSNNSGLWVYNSETESSELLLRTGTAFEVDGQSKLLKSFKVLKVSGGTAQTRHTIGSTIIYQAIFGDGSNGIFRLVR